jgi:hypothetical protein
MVFLQLGFEGWKTKGVQKRSCGESYASPHGDVRSFGLQTGSMIFRSTIVSTMGAGAIN